MYVGASFENFCTVGLMLLGWIIVLHLAGQFGVRIASWLPGGS